MLKTTTEGVVEGKTGVENEKKIHAAYCRRRRGVSLLLWASRLAEKRKARRAVTVANQCIG